MTEYSFKGFVKDLHQKGKGDKYFKAPHTTITFAMVPQMKQEVFEKIVEDIVKGKHFANLAIKTTRKDEEKEEEK